MGLIIALKFCEAFEIWNFSIFTDSELLVNQMGLKYKVKNPNLVGYFKEA